MTGVQHALRQALFLLIGLFFLPGRSMAQHPQNKYFQHIDETNGLSDNSVKCIYRDNRNFIWIGTASGLNLLNGSAITTFHHQPGIQNSLIDNEINCIAGDASGMLWIGTRRGLDLFDPYSRSFKKISLQQSQLADMEPIKAIAIDKNDRIFVATETCFYMYNAHTGKSTLLDIPGSDAEKSLNNQVRDLKFDNKNRLWMAGYNGLWYYDLKTSRFHQVVSRQNDNQFADIYTSIAIGNNGTIWLGTWGGGLKKFDERTGAVTTYIPADKQHLVFDKIALLPSADTNSRLMVSDGLLKFDSKTREFEPWSASKPHCTAILVTDNMLWYGSNDGLYFCKLQQPSFAIRRFPEKITEQGIAIFQWNNNLLVGAANRYFLKQYDQNLHEMADYHKAIGLHAIDCLSLGWLSADSVRCGTSAGLIDLNIKTKGFVRRTIHDPGARQNQLDFITAVFRDSRDQWWLFPWRNGIWQPVPGRNSFQKISESFQSVRGKEKQLVISSVCEDQNRNLWMSDLDEGIIFYQRNTGRFTKPFADVLIGTGCSQVICYRRTCYSFSGNSLLTWDTDTAKMRVIPLSPLTDKNIQSLAMDSSGTLWICAIDRLIAYNRAKKSWSLFSCADGLPPATRFDGTLYCCRDGRMVYGSGELLFSFDPAKLLHSIHAPPLLTLTDIELNGQPVVFKDSAENRFGHDAHNFVFHWAVTDYTDPLNNRYFYKLSGLDQDWRYAGKAGFLQLANLSPGRYRLLLKGENSNGMAAANVLAIQFVILPVFWQTWWFILLSFIAMALIFYGLYRYRLNQLRRVERIRNNISMNLHDEIGSTLSSISILSEMALHRKPDDQAAGMLEEIRQNATTVLESMDDIVWSINPAHDTLKDLFIRIRTFAAQLFEAKEIGYHIDISDTIGFVHPDMEHRRHIYLIVKEAINNLVKHSGCTLAEIEVNYNAPWLCIRISDNGKGFDPENSNSGNGLYTMQKRAVETKAEIHIQSAQDTGTTVRIRVKIK